MNRKIEFYKHNLTDTDKDECLRVLDSLFLTTGDITKSFESTFSKYLGSGYAVGLHSCTEALHMALNYFNINASDEVITTPLSFIATANAVEYTGAKPIFVDVEDSTGNIDIKKTERAITKKTKAIIPVHLYGQMSDMRGLRKLADAYNLKIIEDSAHCIEGEREGIKPGQLGDIACYSFYATKNITCGEGGAISCRRKTIYDWFLKARLHGMSKNAADRYTKKYEHYDMEFLGYKANMSNIQAALLLHQLDRIEKYLRRKEHIATLYTEAFKKNPFIAIPEVLPNVKHARHIYTIWVNETYRDRYIRILQDRGIGVAVNFRPIHLMKYYRKKYHYKTGDFPIAEKIGSSTITLPLYPKLKEEDIAYIIRSVNDTVKQ